jgi:hypothetical protein
MTSLRKKYQDYQDFQSPSNKSAPVVASTPVQAAELPPAAEPQKPLEEIKKPSAADEAAANAIKQRLREMDEAEKLQSEAVQHHQRLAAEPQREQQTAQAIPAHVQDWLNRHPEYLNDAVAQAELNVATMKCVRDGLNWNDNDFIPTIERHLGWQQQPPAPTKTAPTHAPVSAPAEPPRDSAPVRQQQRPGPPVSAPPTRDVPSLASGRPTTRRVPLTETELQIAKNSGISPEEYQLQKEKMRAMQAAGVIQNGGR